MKKMIVGVCDPYNAKTHYRGQRVLEWDIATPTAWVIDDGDGRGLTEREAAERLAELICWADSARFVSEKEANEERERITQEEGEHAAYWGMSWFIGPGFYAWDDNFCVMRQGEDSFRDDVMVYRIEDYVAA